MSVYVVLFINMLLLYACAATGPKLETVKDSFPLLGENSGRLFFYRKYATFGSAMRPDIFVCGKKAGESIPGGVFYVDLPVGECVIEIPSELYPGERSLRVNISPRGVQYIRTWIGGSAFVGRTNMEFVPETTAIEAMKGLAVTNTSE